MQQKTRRIANPHAHSRGQILGVRHGIMAVRTESAYWLVGPGQALWLPPLLEHKARSHGAIQGWSLFIAPSRSNILPEDPFLIRCTSLLMAQAERLSHCASGLVWNDVHARLAESFWDELLVLPHASVSLPFPQDVRLRRVVDALSENPSDRREQQDWAYEASMSVRSFVRYFRQETGMSFSAWRQRLRIINAQERLASGEAVTRVALDVGYESIGAFSATFRKITGCTPKEYSIKMCI
ncbi:AraC family transcriptional regulator [Neokomagataea anthophila]|nr:helix-turn-helix transcriptional regulator [Neokomagataea anthophila]